MKKIILFFFLAVTLTTCKKDYPDDIPQWVKDEIVNSKKTGSCLGISEYINTENQQIVYVLHRYREWECAEYYDYNGTYLCKYGIVWCPCDSCGGTPIHSIVPKRTIWSQDLDRCN